MLCTHIDNNTLESKPTIYNTQYAFIIILLINTMNNEAYPD